MMFTRKLFVSILGACSILLANASYADFQGQLAEKYPTTAGAKIERAFPGFWSVFKNNDVIFINDDMTVMIHGDVIDLIGNQSLTAKIKGVNQPKIDTSALPIKDAIKLGKGTRRIYVFSDPNCHYCQQLERDLYLLQNTEIFIFPMPILQNSRVVSESIWCQSNPEKAWRAYMDSGVTPKFSTCDNPISRNLALAERLQIRGTPAIIFEDGTLVPGVITAAQINDKLKGMAAK